MSALGNTAVDGPIAVRANVNLWRSLLAHSPGKAKFSDLLIPWATFTEPEVAHVGLYPRDMKAKSIAFDTFTKKVSAQPFMVLVF